MVGCHRKRESEKGLREEDRNRESEKEGERVGERRKERERVTLRS